MERGISRLMFAAPRSGSGKTLITCGFLEAVKKRGISPVSFKCGPDYIDPMFHKYVLGIAGGNLDSFFLEAGQVREILLGVTEAEGGELAVIEGVMGYYDGLAGVSTDASSYDIARICDTPVVLILDCKGASVSLGAVVKGFLEYRSDSHIKGVILNRLPGMLYERLAPVIEETGVKVYGYLPENPAYHLNSRHLGLFMPEEVDKLRDLIAALAEGMEETVDLDGLLRLAVGAGPLKLDKTPEFGKTPETDRTPEAAMAKKEVFPPVRIGIARDEAFCFYYQENLKLLEQVGAEIIYFSPVHDKKLPDSLDGLLLGGGYPENYGKALSENDSMLRSVRAASDRGMPILAECGGFMYLHRSMEGSDGNVYEMAGVLDGRAFKTEKLQRFGYITLTMPSGKRVKGHEFHYWESSSPGSSFRAIKPLSGREWSCIHARDGLTAGFPHLYYPSNPEFIKEWVESCRKIRRENERHINDGEV